jgi:glycosyltransferase involved in cell wall biosynthesis
VSPPRISVITPTWRRHDVLLGRCVPSVAAQSWPAAQVQHVIVSDGPDPQLAAHFANQPGIVFDQLPDHDDGGPVDYGSRARNRGLELADGALIAYLDDDNAYRPTHLADLAAVLAPDPNVDFAYSQAQTSSGLVVGAAQPVYTGLDTSTLMHWWGVPQRLGLWPLPADLAGGDLHAPDWGVVSRWLAGGARWVHLPQVTVDYWC